MMKVKSAEEYNTSRGKTFVFETDSIIKIGDKIEINGTIHRVKNIILPTVPSEKNIVSVIV